VCGNIFEDLNKLFKARNDPVHYIDNFNWNIVEDLDSYFPNLRNLVSKVTLPNFDSDDTLVWQHTSNGDLPIKKAYRFKKHSLLKLPWMKFV